jgi:Dolichyl-phosphate-mannose-protein mannosyltransferase
MAGRTASAPSASSAQMPRALRVYVLACLALAFAYLLLHAREPLRLNVGDPEADAAVLTAIARASPHGAGAASVTQPGDPGGPGDPGAVHDPGPLPLGAERARAPAFAERLYGAIGTHLGVTGLGTLRLLALALSALAMWLLYQYARRMWSDPVALLATALFATSLLWMTHADGLHHAPITQASGFLALWGVVRAIETRQRRHHAAALLGSCVCYLSSHDYWLFLPAAALFTVHVQLGNPLARGHRRFLLAVAAGCVAGLVTKALFGIGAAGWEAHVLELPGRATIDQKTLSALPTLVRRYSLVLTPMCWVTLGHTAWRALRAPSPRAVLADGVTWLAVVTAIPMYLLARPAAVQMLGAELVLPFYAIGSALLIGRLLGGVPVGRGLAIAWVCLAPAWSFGVLLGQPRAVLDRADVAQANAYLAAHDGNDFVITNLLSEGPIQAAFARHSWAALDDDRPTEAHAKEPQNLSYAQVRMLELFEAAGTDQVHAVIFTTPDSRVVDHVLWSLVAGRQLWSVTGWPHLNRAKANRLIRAYDKDVLKDLAALDAKQVLHLRNFDIYRIERAAVRKAMGQAIPFARTLDFGSVGAYPHKLLGWAPPSVDKDTGLASTRLAGYPACLEPAPQPRAGAPGTNPCKTWPTRRGLRVLDDGHADRAQLMIRVERACDLRLTVALAQPALLRVSLEDFTSSPCALADHASFVIPARAVHEGLNVLTFEQRFGPRDSHADLASLTIDPICASAEPPPTDATP